MIKNEILEFIIAVLIAVVFAPPLAKWLRSKFSRRNRQ